MKIKCGICRREFFYSEFFYSFDENLAIRYCLECYEKILFDEEKVSEIAVKRKNACYEDDNF